MKLLKQVLCIAEDFYPIYAKITLTQILVEIYFPLQMIVNCFLQEGAMIFII